MTLVGPGAPKTMYAGYMKSEGVFNLAVIGGNILNSSVSEVTFSLTNTSVGNPLFSFKYYFKGNLSN